MSPHVQHLSVRCHAGGCPGSGHEHDRPRYASDLRSGTHRVDHPERDPPLEHRGADPGPRPGSVDRRWISLALGREDMPLERSSLPLLAVVGGLAVAYEASRRPRGAASDTRRWAPIGARTLPQRPDRDEPTDVVPGAQYRGKQSPRAVHHSGRLAVLRVHPPLDPPPGLLVMRVHRAGCRCRYAWLSMLYPSVPRVDESLIRDHARPGQLCGSGS